MKLRHIKCDTTTHHAFRSVVDIFTPRALRGVYEISVRRIVRIGDRPATDWPLKALIGENFKWPYLRKGSSDPLHVWFCGGVFRDGGSNGAISSFAKSKAAILENSNGDISAADHPIYSMFGPSMGFSGTADRMALIPVWPNSSVIWAKTMCEE